MEHDFGADLRRKVKGERAEDGSEEAPSLFPSTIGADNGGRQSYNVSTILSTIPFYSQLLAPSGKQGRIWAYATLCGGQGPI
jgi:hypothetical protein